MVFLMSIERPGKKNPASSEVRDRGARGRASEGDWELEELEQESITGAAPLQEPRGVPQGWGWFLTSQAAAQNTTVLKRALLAPGSSGNNPCPSSASHS